jgi:hypothetical protein
MEKQPLSIGVRLDRATRVRCEAVRLRLSRAWQEATLSEAYRVALAVGVVAAEALQREGQSLLGLTRGPPREGAGEDMIQVHLRVDAATKRRVEEVRAKLSREWRVATISDACRLLVVLGLDHVEATRGKDLRDELTRMFAVPGTRGRAGRG